MPRWRTPRTPRARAPSPSARRAGCRETKSSVTLRAHSAQIGEVEKDRQHDQADEAQAAADASPPQLDPVDRAVRRAGIPHGILGGEMIRRALRGARQRRGCESVALAKLPEAFERLAPLLFLAFTRIDHGLRIGLRAVVCHRQTVDAAAMIRDPRRGILGLVACTKRHSWQRWLVGSPSR